MKANFETGLKICSHCRRELPLDQFSGDKSTSDGLNGQCRSCNSLNAKRYRNSKEGKEALKRGNEKYKKTEKYKITTARNNKKPRIKTEEQKLRTKEYHKKWDAEYLKSEKGSEIKKRSIKKWRDSGKLTEYRRRKYNSNICFRIETLLRNRICDLLKGKVKSDHTLNLLGCTVEELKQYLENQFIEGMTWENYGEWQIDHIIPCAYFDLSIEKNQYICFNFRNLQPLWANENRRKRDEVPENVEELIENLRKEIGL